MNKRNLGERIKLTSYEEMFGTKNNNSTSGQIVQKSEMTRNQIIEVPLDKLYAFKKHPFRVTDDEKMEEMVESVRENGILVPVMVRPREEGGYEIISGHRRSHAAMLAGLKSMPVIVKDYNDDEATVIMVDANIQREDILPSEKAKAYSMKYEALKHQGKERGNGLTLEVVGEAGGDGVKTVQRYIRLSKLTDPMLELVDMGKLGLGQGVDLSFLSEEAQGWVYDIITNRGCTVSGVQSAIIKERYKAGELTATLVMEILCYENPKKHRKVTIGSKKLSSYFEPSVSSEEIERVIISLLDEWKQKGGGL